MYDVLIKNGKLVAPDRIYEAEIAIKDGKYSAFLAKGTEAKAKEGQTREEKIRSFLDAHDVWSEYVATKNIIDMARATGGSAINQISIALFGNSITVMLNAGDYSRELRSGCSTGKRGVAYFIAMVPTTVLLGLIGAMASTATGIANPINAFSQMVHNKVLLVVTLGFILFAQMTTNLASNVVPPAYAFMDVFKMKHRTAVILVGILAVCTCPWILTNDSSAAGLDMFVKIYTAFFGPIFAVLVTDHFILRKQKVDLKALYDEKGNFAGVNWAAILAIVVGAVIGLFNADISFFTATIPTGIVYVLGMKYFASCKRFKEGTILK